MASPRALLVLGSLRILTRNVTLDDLKEATFISKETHRLFFVNFMKWYSTSVFPHVVKMPTLEEIRNNGAEYESAGFPGCLGSVDCVHMRCRNLAHNLKQTSTGKAKFPSRVFECVTNHRGQILACTRGFYGSVSDKSIVKFDGAMVAVRKGCYAKNEYAIYSRDGELLMVKGAYFICDNGYHKWPTMMEPTKDSNGDQDNFIWSEMNESLRKDVECLFGQMKQEFGILKYGSRFQSLDLIDDIFQTCCAIHNQRKTLAGSDLMWSTVQLDNPDENDLNQDGPAVFRRQAVQVAPEAEVGLGEWNLEPTEIDPTHAVVKQQLITHFKMAASLGKVFCWPTKDGSIKRYIPSNER